MTVLLALHLNPQYAKGNTGDSHSNHSIKSLSITNHYEGRGEGSVGFNAPATAGPSLKSSASSSVPPSPPSTDNFTAGQWIELPLAEGGVAQDVQILRQANNEPGEVLWSANMESGLFRSEFQSGAGTWGPWESYMRHTGFLGVDAIQTGGHEHVLAGGAFTGGYYQRDPAGVSALWDRPNALAHGPLLDHWQYVRAHDVAFYAYPNGTYPADPQTKYLVIVSEDNHPAGSVYEAGIYQWTGTAPKFYRRVDSQYGGPRGYHYFWRDLGDPNLMYTIKARPKGSGEAGALCLIRGGYDNLHFQEIPIPGADVLDVWGFNQWKEANGDVYSYVLFRDQRGVFQVWSAGPRTLDQLSFQPLGEVDPRYLGGDGAALDNWTSLTRYNRQVGYPQVVGRPGPSGHQVWLSTSERYGVIYWNGGPPWTQINGPSNTGLKAWIGRGLTPDPGHLQPGERMRFVHGTHKHGVWYMVHSEADPVPQWSHLKAGYESVDLRGGIKLYPDGADPDLLVAAWNAGVFRWEDGAWHEKGIQEIGESSYQTDPALRRGTNAVADFGDYTYLGGGRAKIVVAPDPVPYELGGLYRYHRAQGITEQVEFDPQYSLAQERMFNISNLKPAASGDVQALYITTGLLGSNNSSTPGRSHNVYQFFSSANSTRIYSISSTLDPKYEHQGLMDLAPAPRDPLSEAYLAVGAPFGAPNSGRLERIYRVTPGAPWDSEELWPQNFAHDPSDQVFSVAAIADPLYPGEDIVFWGVHRYNAQGAGSGYTVGGSLWMRRYDPSQSSGYRTQPLYNVTSTAMSVAGVPYDLSPASGDLYCLNWEGKVLLVTTLAGTRTGLHVSNLFIAQIDGYQGQWSAIPNPVLPSGAEYQVGAHGLAVDVQNGFDIYAAGGPTVFKYDNALPGVTAGGPDGSEKTVPASVRISGSGAAEPPAEECRLGQSHPNPFNPTTAIGYQLSAPARVSLRVYDTAGREVAKLADGWRDIGAHEVTFDASGLPSGIYFARLSAGNVTQVQKLILLK